MGSEVTYIADQIERSWRGEAWSGPALREILADVDEASARKSLAGSHSIWELLLHVSHWEQVSMRRTLGEHFEPADADNFPAPSGSWQDALAKADAAHDALVSAVRALTPEALGQKAPGCPYSVRFMLHGVAQHNLYHAGQMAILKRA